MKRIFSSPLALVSTGLLTLFVTASWSQAQTPCRAADSHCVAKLLLQEYTGPPPIPFCLIGAPIVQIDSKAACPSGGAGRVRVLRCGILDIPFSYSGSGVTHTLGTSSDWESVLDGACGDLTYSADPS